MPKIDVYDIQGKKVSTVDLKDEIFGIEPNEAVVHSVLVNFLANQRQGTQSTKTRAEVRGGGRKPWRQKGTGRARQGSTKSAQWKGGGIIFAPKPRDFSEKINKKMRVSAFKSAISAKLADSEVVILESLALESPKTKLFKEIMDNFKIGHKNVMFVLKDKDDDILRASNNIENAKVTYADVLNTYDIVSNTKLYITKDAIKKIEEAYK